MLAEKDYKDIADQLDVELAVVRAFIRVECNETGFLPDGRPKVLFERHIMYRRVRDKHGKATADLWQRDHPDLCNQTPGGYGRQSTEPDRMGRAAELDRECALESASWGMPQVMGYHWERVGYQTLQSFINAMYRSERSQMDAFIGFVQTDPALHRAMKRRDWLSMAKLYNGPAQKGYDVKLKDEYDDIVGG